jgi:hypothetical protein
MIKKSVWLLSFLVLSTILVLAEVPSLTDYMQIHGKLSSYIGDGDDFYVQVGENPENTFLGSLNSDGTYGKNYAWKIYNGKPGDKLYFYVGTQIITATETYLSQSVKEINLVMPPDCSNQDTWTWSWSACINKSKTGTFTCEGKPETKTEECCEPDWKNCTDWSSCDSKKQSRVCFDANACNPASLNKTETQSCGGSSSSNNVVNWSCEDWSPCNSLLKKTRLCKAVGSTTTKTEEVACDKCIESWVCSLWTECKYGTQSRTCNDLHLCGTTILKPTLSKACEEKPSAFQQTYTPPPKSDSTPPPKIVPDSTSASKKSTINWGDYKYYMMGLATFIVLAIVAVVVIFAIRKRAGGSSDDLSAVEKWATKEREAGMPETNIRTALVNQGWEEGDINKILR